jgi:CRP-like cAMP-binding protein
MALFSFFDLLRQIPLFSALSNSDLFHFADRLVVEVVPSDTVIVEEGLPGSALYIIQKGRVKVISHILSSGEEIRLAELESGHYFGEMSLLTNEPRSATVIAMEETHLLRLEKEDFELLLNREPILYKTLGLILSQRLKETTQKRMQAEEQLRQNNISGQLNNNSVLNLIHFCEENKVSGTLDLKNGTDYSRIYFDLGVIERVVLNDEEHPELLDTLVKWEKGEYFIRPEMGSQSTFAQSAPVPKVETQNILLQTFNTIINYSVGILGAAVVKNLLNKSLNEARGLFPDFRHLSVLANCFVALNQKVKFPVNEKNIIRMATWIRIFFRECDKIAVGFSRIDLRTLTTNFNKDLDALDFFQYYENVTELIND